MDNEYLVEKLLCETSAALQRAAGKPESIRGVIFLYLNRAYEARLEPDLICDLLGVSQGNVFSRANVSRDDEAVAMDAFQSLDSVLEQQYRDKNCPHM